MLNWTEMTHANFVQPCPKCIYQPFVHDQHLFTSFSSQLKLMKWHMDSRTTSPKKCPQSHWNPISVFCMFYSKRTHSRWKLTSHQVRHNATPGSSWLVAIGLWMCTIHAAHRYLYYIPCISSVYECKWDKIHTFRVCRIIYHPSKPWVSLKNRVSMETVSPGPMHRVWERASDRGWDTIIIDLVQGSLNGPDGYPPGN